MTSAGWGRKKRRKTWENQKVMMTIVMIIIKIKKNKKYRYIVRSEELSLIGGIIRSGK
jgi:hypothetical protein